MKKILLLILIVPFIAACEMREPRISEPENKMSEESVNQIESEKMSDKEIDALDDDSDGDSIGDVEESAERRRVEVLKSNKQGDPNANKYDFGNDAGDNDCDDGVASADGSCESKEVVNDMDNDCDSSTDEACENLDDDDDGDSIPTTDNTNITN